MKVVVREPAPWCFTPGMWHFLEDNEGCYLYVNCEQSFVSFPIMIKLNAEEYSEYHALGWTFLQYFAEKINYWSSRYMSRKVNTTLQAEAEAAIMRG